jgi:hypothetical protein
MGRVVIVADQSYQTAPQPAPERDRSIFGRKVRGNWTTGDLVAPSNLRFFLGLLDQPLDQEQAGAPRHARAMLPPGPGRLIPFRLLWHSAYSQRGVARDSAKKPVWSELTRRIEQPAGSAVTAAPRFRTTEWRSWRAQHGHLFCGRCA